jgi:hypothetical protein
LSKNEKDYNIKEEDGVPSVESHLLGIKIGKSESHEIRKLMKIPLKSLCGIEILF